MTLDQIKELVAQGESSTLEFKTSTGQLRAAFETICAFLNSDGGTVLIGVSDKGRIVGQEVADKTRKEIAEKISDIEPPAQSEIHVDYVSIGDSKHIIVIKVKTGVHVPYAFDGRPYHRIQSTSQKMPHHRYQQLIKLSDQFDHSWESVIVPEYSIDDLDQDLIKTVIRKAIKKGRLEEDVSTNDIEDFLYRFRLLIDGKLKRAALILFCKNEHKQFMQSQLRLARFRGTTKNEFIDNKFYIGNIFYLYDRAISFLNNYLPISGNIEENDPIRIDKPAIPNKVLREVMVNALCHKDYSIIGGAISVGIYDDRVEVSSTGAFPAGINITNLLSTHQSTPRNPLIASVFHAAGYIEKWGRGIEKIINLSKEAGNPEPRFEETGIDINVYLPLREEIISGNQIISAGKATLSLREEEIVTILKKYNFVNVQIISEQLKTPTSQRTIQGDLAKLKKLGLVQSQGKGRATVWGVVSNKV